MKAFFAIFLVAASATGAAIYNFDDAVRDMAPNGKGARQAADFIRIFAASDFRADERAKEFFGTLHGSFSNFDFDEFYKNPYLEPLDNGYRGLGLAGRRKFDAYDLCMSRAAYQAGLAPELGSFRAELAFRQNKREGISRTYSAYLKARVALEEISNESLIRLNEGFLKVIAPDNLKNLQSLRTRSQRHIPLEALVVIQEMYRIFPEFSEIFKKYLYILHSHMKREAHQGKEYTRNVSRAFFRLDMIKKDYPALADYLDQLKNLFELEVLVRNKSGNILFKSVTESQQDFFALTLLTREGRVIPFNNLGQPVFDEEIRVADLTDYDFDVTVNLRTNVYGLKFDTYNILLDGHYENSPEAANFNLRLARVPKPRIHGKLAQVLPAWLINLAMPTNMEEITDEFAQVLVNANGGEGTFLDLAWEKKDPGNKVMNLAFSTEVLDNFYVRFSLAMIKHLFRTGGETRREAGELMDATVQGLLADLDSLAESGD